MDHMTMVRARTTLSNQEDQETQILLHLQNPFYNYYGGFCGKTSSYNYNNLSNNNIDLMTRFEEDWIGSNHHHQMADHHQHESRTNTSDLNEEAAGSSSKEAIQEERDHHEGWLQLSIGASSSSSTRAIPIRDEEEEEDDDPILGGARRRPPGDQLLELDLLQRGGTRSFPSTNNPPRPSSFRSSSLFFHHHPPNPNPLPPFHQQEMNWGLRPMLHGFAAAPSSSSFITLGSYFSRPFQLHGGAGRLDVPVLSQEFRVIDPPRRPFSSFWFMLQASQNQVKEPFLPQISKSYLRIKDGRMTVRLLLKYLVNKLRLDCESEIEITCRGQLLQPILTLQQVRDNIWSPREAPTLLPYSSTTDHIMVLHYARRTLSLE